MNLKIASLNISGGFYIGDESTEYLDREASSSVDNKLLEDIIKIINEKDFDIICFQEIITTEAVKYIENIMANTKLKYKEDFELSPCNLVKYTDCGLAILSKHPITNSVKNIFTNPKLSKTTSSGNTYYLFDKGYLLVNIKVNEQEIKVLTHHGFPFRRFNSTPELNEKTFKEFDEIIKTYKPDIVTGDFNAENFQNMMPYTNDNYIRSIDEITTVDGMKFDDILLLKDTKYSMEMIKSFSDHYLVYVEI